MASIGWIIRLGLSLAVMAAVTPATRAQPPVSGSRFGSSVVLGGDEGELDVAASFTKAEGKQPAQLTITAEIPAGWHIFSITQSPGGPNKTKIKLDPSKDFRNAGDFSADPAPKVGHSAAYGDLPIETHEGRVSWRLPIELTNGVDPAALKIGGAVSAQRCLGEEKCLPPKSFKFSATLAEPKKGDVRRTEGGAIERGARQPPIPEARPAAPFGNSGQFKPSGAHVVLRGWIEPSVTAPGSIATLVLAAEPTDGYHIYALSDRDPRAVGLGKPTLIALTQSSGLRYTRPEANQKPLEKPAGAGLEGVVRYYEAPIRWTAQIEIPQLAKSGAYPIGGIIGFHTCNDAVGCDLPQAAEFQGILTIGRAVVQSPAPLQFRPAEYSEVAKLAEQTAQSPAPLPAAAAQATRPIDNALDAPGAAALAVAQPMTLSAVILFSLLGGLILNLMPCVLPVIGLKILAFVEQGGKSRGHIFALNLWYSLGLIAVFMALATLAAYAGLAWGQHFQSVAFNVVLSAIVFVMALSFLGVWEIPIPGFVGSGKAVEVAAREGAVGAFAKGALTTVLATPCSGPFLGSVFGYALKQPPQIVYLLFGCIGLGMASPYLVIGAFPNLVRFLPKPGAWMDTFKQMMGFVLLGTVVYLFSFLKRDYLIPTFALLIGLWSGCWWIGRTPLTAELGRKLRAWLVGGAVAAAVGAFAFIVLVPGPALLDWQPFSQTRLKQLTSEGKTVLVDFTADWCPTCKWNLRFAINTTEVRDIVKRNEVVPLVADWTEESTEIKAALASLRSQSIPVLAVFPADRPQTPIVLRDLVSRSQVLDALEQAGPSRKEVGTAGAAQAAEKPPGVAALR
ncbi:MAG TPA: thioredoxin family protein [Pirellulales bacterium]|jgi:thiol:disulfide interchange protein|nr:thioredoxin family protein [Pirellulales bacterium]